MTATYQDAASRKEPNRNLDDEGAVRRGRPRSDAAHQAILESARELLVEEGFTKLRLEHVAARAGVGKATIYRRWPSKELLCLELLMELAHPYLPTPDLGDTRAELEAVVGNVLTALTNTAFGPVIRALLSQIAGNPALGDPFRATIVKARRDEVARVVALGVARGDLRPDVDPNLVTELLLGPLYFRMIFGGDLDPSVVGQLARSVMEGFGTVEAMALPGWQPDEEDELFLLDGAEAELRQGDDATRDPVEQREG
ncbi:MAG: TetR/AcrR family transcriptional regulator [Chloroflexota bacterium]